MYMCACAGTHTPTTTPTRTDAQLPPIKAYIQKVAPNAQRILECTKGSVDLSALLGLESFSLAKVYG